MKSNQISKFIFANILLICFAGPTFAKAESHSTAHKLSPVGRPADANKAMKKVSVIASDDMKFKFLQPVEFNDGDIVTFEVTNAGKIPHEFSIGDEKEQKDHQEMMRKMPNMVHKHGNTITLKPGETKTLTWEFKSGNDVVFARRGTQ